MRLADHISRELIGFARGGGREILIQNFYHGMYEMDLFRLMPSGFVVEYEIKISRSDFFADFKKGDKHRKLVGGAGANRFYFVVPKGLVSYGECPQHCGLIYANCSKNLIGFTTQRVAPILTNRKVKPEIYRDLAESLAFREMHLRQKLRAIREREVA